MLAVLVQVLSFYTDFVSTDTYSVSTVTYSASTDTYSASTKLLYETLPAISVLVGLLGFTACFGLVFKDTGLEQGFGL